MTITYSERTGHFQAERHRAAQITFQAGPSLRGKPTQPARPRRETASAARARVTLEPATAHHGPGQAPTAPAVPAASVGMTADKVTTLLDQISQERHRELIELRARFNRPSEGAWGILFLPNHGVWVAFKDKKLTLTDTTAAALHDRIASGYWVAAPRPPLAA